jgi:hypothetical protein
LDRYPGIVDAEFNTFGFVFLSNEVNPKADDDDQKGTDDKVELVLLHWVPSYQPSSADVRFSEGVPYSVRRVTFARLPLATPPFSGPGMLQSLLKGSKVLG